MIGDKWPVVVSAASSRDRGIDELLGNFRGGWGAGVRTGVWGEIKLERPPDFRGRDFLHFQVRSAELGRQQATTKDQGPRTKDQGPRTSDDDRRRTINQSIR
jgi:hypothetical protein